MAIVRSHHWRTIGLWIVVAILSVLVIAWLAGAFERPAPREPIQPEAMPEQPQPETVEPDGIVPAPEQQKQPQQ